MTCTINTKTELKDNKNHKYLFCEYNFSFPIKDNNYNFIYSCGFHSKVKHIVYLKKAL